MFQGMRPTPRSVTGTFIALFVLGALINALVGLDAADRCIDWTLFGWIALALSSAAAVLGAAYSDKATPLARASNALFGAVATGMAAFTLLVTLHSALDRSPTVMMVVRRSGVVRAAGRHWMVRIDGRDWLLAERLRGACTDSDEATLAVSRGAFGQRWIRVLRCAPRPRG